MTKEEFLRLAQTTVLLDGATGTNLMAAGMPRGACTEEWVLEHRSVIQDLQRAYKEAGSRIIYAPTFGGNRVNLTRHHLEDRLAEINETLVGFCRDAVGHSVYIAGDITTTGEMMEPFGDYTYESAFEVYREQIRCLYDAGVDLLVAETMISIKETLAAIDAARSVCTLPIMCTVTVDAGGRLFTGGTAVEAAKAFADAGACAVGVNCSVGPEQLPAVIRKVREAVVIPVIAKPNAGTPVMDALGHAHYHMQPEEFAGHMKQLKAEGASLLGGCCGTTPEFIRCLRESL
ncbi:MAG: homocysteine S-methyltransferase family protein [Blautia sp.]|nr:homocysteine S-methyltransferase family protein [Blautia sp.]